MAKNKLTYPLYLMIKGLVRLCYPKIEVVGAENLPDGCAIVIGNHSQMNGPIACELYMPGRHYTWCAAQMMHIKEVPAYAFDDFWRDKPKSIRWLFKIASYLIAPLSVLIFTNADTIGVYHDARIFATFKETVKRLQEGANVVILPESRQKHNHIVNDFHEGFIDAAKFYKKSTGREITFVPMYLAPALRKMYLGKPIEYNSENSRVDENKRIKAYLMDEITRMAESLPAHTVVPYDNIKKKDYPSNKA